MWFFQNVPWRQKKLHNIKLTKDLQLFSSMSQSYLFSLLSPSLFISQTISEQYHLSSFTFSLKHQRSKNARQAFNFGKTCNLEANSIGQMHSTSYLSCIYQLQSVHIILKIYITSMSLVCPFLLQTYKLLFASYLFGISYHSHQKRERKQRKKK